MAPLRWIGRLAGAAWDLLSSSSYGCYLLLVGLFFILGLGLVLLGFDLAEVDLWLDAQGGLFDAVGTILLRIVCGLVLLLCILAWGWAIAARLKSRARSARAANGGEAEKPPGWGCLLIAVPTAWFAWVGMTMDY
jgi:hypothetical protein